MSDEETSIISFKTVPKTGGPVEIMRLDSTGMTYMGKRIEDAGEAHKAFLETLQVMQKAAND